MSTDDQLWWCYQTTVFYIYICTFATKVIVIFQCWSRTFKTLSIAWWSSFDPCRTYSRVSGMIVNVCLLVVVVCGIVTLHYLPASVFTRAELASSARVIAVIVCLCVCVSHASQYCIKKAKGRITQTTPRDSPGNLVSWRQQRNFDQYLLIAPQP